MSGTQDRRYEELGDIIENFLAFRRNSIDNLEIIDELTAWRAEWYGE